jgi:hypothetical protein
MSYLGTGRLSSIYRKTFPITIPGEALIPFRIFIVFNIKDFSATCQRVYACPNTSKIILEVATHVQNSGNSAIEPSKTSK